MKLYKQVLMEAMISNEKDVKVKRDAAAGVIIRVDENNTKQVLLIQRSRDDHWPNHWEFPRGGCDKPVGENVKHCALREIKEETGLDVEIIELIDTFQYLADNGTRLTTCYNYLCKMKDENQQIKLSKEHQDFKWISEVGQAEILIMPEQKKTIEKVLNSSRSIVSYPYNDFTKNNKIEEYLKCLFQE